MSVAWVVARLRLYSLGKGRRRGREGREGEGLSEVVVHLAVSLGAFKVLTLN
jgi:hypothetical protein